MADRRHTGALFTAVVGHEVAEMYPVRTTLETRDL